LQLDSRERRNAVRQGRPHRLFEETVFDFEVEAIRIGIFRRRHASDEASPLRPEIDARRIDRERCRTETGLPAIEDINEPLARPDREVESGHRRDLASTYAGGVDERAASDLTAVVKSYCFDPITATLNPAGGSRLEFRSQAASLAPECLKQAIGVDP